MDRNIAESELKPVVLNEHGSGVRFELATADDDPSIRRLLRENPFPGEISLSFQTEPSYFAATGLHGPNHYTIVARENNRLVCVGTVSERLRFINGNPTNVGYLSSLRLDRTCRNKFSIIRRGYRFFHQLHLEGGSALYLTSIISDNAVARRLLERGLPDMPTYHYLEEFITLVMPVALPHQNPAAIGAAMTFRNGTDADVPAIVSLLNCCNKNYQFAVVWREKDLSAANDGHSLKASDFCHGFDGNELVACAALWDQRTFKQTVIAGYSTRLRLLNRLTHFIPWTPRLPNVGATLAQAFVSSVAAKADYEPLLPSIISFLAANARRRGLEYLVMGFSAREDRGMIISRRFHGRRFSSRLYDVRWPSACGGDTVLDDRPASPEVALL